MNLTYRVLGRINTILHFQNLQKANFYFQTRNSSHTILDFTRNPHNHAFLHKSISIARLLELHQASLMQYIFNYYASLHEHPLPPEPMYDYLRVNSHALPFADNIAQNIVQSITAHIVHTLPPLTNMAFYIKIFNQLDITPFMFFYHPYFDNIDIGTGTLHQATTFTIH